MVQIFVQDIQEKSHISLLLFKHPLQQTHRHPQYAEIIKSLTLFISSNPLTTLESG